MNKTKRNIIIGIAALLIVSVITVASVMGIEKKKAKDKTENPVVEATTAKEGKDNENIEGEGKTTENSDKTDKNDSDKKTTETVNDKKEDKSTTEASNSGKNDKTTETSNNGKTGKTTEHSNSSGGGSTTTANNDSGSNSGGGSTSTPSVDTGSNSGGSGGTSSNPVTTEAPKPTTTEKPSSTTEAPKPSTTEKPKVWHEPVYEQVWIVDEEAWDEPVCEWRNICNQCGTDFTGKTFSQHCNDTRGPNGELNCGGYTSKYIVTHYIHHDEIGHYEDKLVKEGYWE